MKKLIVMDMDGTLLKSNQEIGEKTKKTLLKAQEKGYQLVLASGRPDTTMIDYAKELQMDQYNGYLISHNGAKLSSLKDKRIIWESPLDDNLAKKVLQHADKFELIPLLVNDKELHIKDRSKRIELNGNKEHDIIFYESFDGLYTIRENNNLSRDIDFTLYKILLAGTPSYLQENYQEIKKPFLKEVNAVFSAPFFFEITDLNADKGKALEILRAKLDYKFEDMIGFGDNFNDLSFLSLVGTSVAMENANPKIKDKVKHICLSNDDEGIAEYLNNII